ncbi:MAG: c-type cytochrome [Gallionella sp.]|nr:c-type cytochrome [Gallionella sp.]
MKVLIVSLVAATGLMIAGGAMAADMPAVAKKSGCVACHAIDKKVVGPAWQEVANKYKGDAGAVAMLSTQISKGGKGKWGAVPMPPQPKVSEAEIKELVGFILGLAK